MDEQEEKSLGQSSLFQDFQLEEMKAAPAPTSIFKPVPDWSAGERLLREKNNLGFYISGHPMDIWQKICGDWLGWTVQKVYEYSENQSKRPVETGNVGPRGYSSPARKQIKLAGILGSVKEIITKKGKRMAFAQLEDLTGSLELVFFPDSFMSLQTRVKECSASPEPVIVEGDLEVKEDTPKIFVASLEWAKGLYENRVKQVTLTLRPSQVSIDQMRALKQCLIQNRGKFPIKIYFKGDQYQTQMELPAGFGVNGTPKFVESLGQIVGKDAVVLN